ncbi:MAG: hypothetical protein CMJ64_18550 [Planctomycetaceae bacterium]|nr:hypothetical protein [Planctomycetaceae bacterium]
MFRFSMSTLMIWLTYAAIICALIGTFTIARQRVLASPNPAAEQEDWDQWRDEAARQGSGNGPVSRRVPKTTEPPTRVLLRDYFATSLITLIILSTALYFATAAMIRGVLSGPAFEPDLEDVG